MRNVFSRRQQQHQQHQQLTNNRLELGLSFSSGLPGWFRSCFFVRFSKDFSGTAQICLGFSPGGRGSGCHFRPAAGTRLADVQDSGFIIDFSCTACYRTNLIRISMVPHKFVSDSRPAVGARYIIFGRPRGPGWATSRNAVSLRISVVPHKFR